MRNNELLEPTSWIYGSGGNLRAVWRVSAFVCVAFLANGIVTAMAEPVFAFLSRHAGGLTGSAEWIDAIATLATVTIVLRQIDRKSWSLVGLGKEDARAVFVLRGALLGGIAIAATSFLLFAFGSMQFVPDTLSTLLSGDANRSAPAAWMLSTVRTSFLLAPAAFYEELIFRGYLWRVAEDSGNTFIALATTSVLFGLVHLQNPGANVLAILNVMLAGVCLGLVRIRTGSLWAAWSAHFAWNWIMAAVIHVPVSGLPMATPGYRAAVAGPEWMTGGTWGPEGGAVATLVLVCAIACATQGSFTKFSPYFMRRPNGAVAARG